MSGFRRALELLPEWGSLMKTDPMISPKRRSPVRKSALKKRIHDENKGTTGAAKNGHVVAIVATRKSGAAEEAKAAAELG